MCRSRPQKGCAWVPLVVAGLLLDHQPQTEVELLKSRFPHCLCRARPRPARQGVGPLVQIPDGGAWTVEETGVHRDEQGWRHLLKYLSNSAGHLCTVQARPNSNPLSL